MNTLPRTLNQQNINQTISKYLTLLDNIPLKFESNNILQLLTDLKRKELNYGPYPHVTLFESANRIMSDLTILYGVKELLNGAIKEINFEHYTVDLGHDFNNMHDIEAKNGKLKLYGEGFNVAESFFQIKNNYYPYY